MVVEMELEWGRLAVWDSVGGFGVKTGGRERWQGGDSRREMN
jgi:hypothetical protein